ncbi:1735_t:CDS:2, partial [Cetraspora pellucida]
KSSSQANSQKWILTKEGRIALQSNQKFVLEVKESNKHVILVDSTAKSFKNSPASQFMILPLHPVKKFGAAIGVIRLELVEAKGLKGVDSFLAGVFCAGNNKDIIAQTKVIDNDLNPVWNEVHYLPVRGLNEKFKLEVMDFNTFIKDKPLGDCHLEVNRELAKEASNGVYEGTKNGIDV